MANIKTRVQLTKSRIADERFWLINDGSGMGGYGHPDSHYLNNWCVANGVDRGNGYQGYMSVDFALSADSGLPDSVKALIRKTLGI